MTRYTVASRRRAPNEKPPINPLWRGIGCIMMIVVPLLSLGAAVWAVGFIIGNGWPLPYQLMGQPVLPPLLHQSAFLLPGVLWIESQQNLYAILVLTIAFIVVIGAFVSLVYSFVYRFVGPPRYGPLDLPPENVRVKRYKR